jgi:hypothetical protein
MARSVEKARTRFGLSRSEAVLKTELMARTWQAHAEFIEGIDNPLSSTTGSQIKIDVARLEYLKVIRLLEHFTSDVAAKQREAFLHEPADWQLTQNAQAVDFWIAAYSEFSSSLANLLSFRELEYPPEELLSAFEELPDCP